ncbi:hypothetical protein TNCV_804711 [Trichonephila clavipes]|nr:hypothetical protein TNCV_804711 [Trichonephila clavipes]
MVPNVPHENFLTPQPLQPCIQPTMPLGTRSFVENQRIRTRLSVLISNSSSRRGRPRFQQRLRSSGTYTNFHKQRAPVDITGRVASTYSISRLWG